MKLLALGYFFYYKVKPDRTLMRLISVSETRKHEISKGEKVMAFCTKCGSRLVKDAVFCESCGQKQRSSNTEQTKVKEMKSLNDLNLGVYMERFRRSKNAKVAISVVVLVAVLAIGLSVYGKYQKSKIDLSQYISADFTGYETVGRAAANVNEQLLEYGILEAKGAKIPKSSKNGESTPADSMKMLSQIMTNTDLMNMVDGMEVSVSPNENLKNGDKVTITLNYDSTLMKKLGVRFQNNTKTVEVSGLLPVIEINPFDSLEVTFSGIAPEGYVQLNTNRENYDLPYLGFEADKTENLNIGDTITVTLPQNAEETALENGYKLTETTKTYTVENLDQYITSIAQISDDMLAAMKKEVMDVLESTYASISEKVGNNGFTYAGVYLLDGKNSASDGSIYMVYSTTATSPTGEFAPTLIYLPVKCSNLFLKADGTYDFYCNNEILGDSGVKFDNNGWWSSELAGYTDGGTMFNDLVVTKKASYKYEVSEGLKLFGE